MRHEWVKFESSGASAIGTVYRLNGAIYRFIRGSISFISVSRFWEGICLKGRNNEMASGRRNYFAVGYWVQQQSIFLPGTDPSSFGCT